MLEAYLRKVRVKTAYMRDQDGEPKIVVKTVIGFSYKFKILDDGKRVGNTVNNIENAVQLRFNYNRVSTTVQDYYLNNKSLESNCFWGIQLTIIVDYRVTLEKPLA